MKFAYLTVALLLLASPVIASEFCDQTAAVARQVMMARQSGEPMEVMMKAAKMQEGDYSKLVEQIVTDAYSVDMKMHRELKEKEIAEFGNRNYKACLSLK